MTPPPSSQKYIPKPQRNQGKMMPNNKVYSKPIQSSVSGPQPVQQTINASAFKMMTINPPPQAQFNQPPPSHYVPQQQQPQQQNSQQIHNQQGLNNAEGGNKMNGDGRSEMNRNENSNNSNNNNKSMQPPRGSMRIMNPTIPVSFSEPPPSLNQVSNQHMGKPPTLSMHIPPPQLQAVPTVPDGHQQAIHVPQPVVVVATHQIPIHAAPPQPQRPQRDPIMRSRNEEIRSLRQFHNDFNLVPPPQGQQQQAPPPQVPQQASQTIQTIPPQQQRPEMQDSGQNPMVHSSGPTNVDNSQPPPPHMVGGKPQHVNNANVNHHVTHHPTPSSTPHQEKSHGPSTTPPQANTPQQNVNSSNVNSSNSSSGSASNSSETTPTGNDKAALGTKKFQLNPQAKPFTPRNPSTPTQSRYVLLFNIDKHKKYQIVLNKIV